jgi:hypothetical protein
MRVMRETAHGRAAQKRGAVHPSDGFGEEVRVVKLAAKVIRQRSLVRGNSKPELTVEGRDGRVDRLDEDTLEVQLQLLQLHRESVLVKPNLLAGLCVEQDPSELNDLRRVLRDVHAMFIAGGRYVDDEVPVEATENASSIGFVRTSGCPEGGWDLRMRPRRTRASVTASSIARRGDAGASACKWKGRLGLTGQPPLPSRLYRSSAVVLSRRRRT